MFCQVSQDAPGCPMTLPFPALPALPTSLGTELGFCCALAAWLCFPRLAVERIPPGQTKASSIPAHCRGQRADTVIGRVPHGEGQMLLTDIFQGIRFWYFEKYCSFKWDVKVRGKTLKPPRVWSLGIWCCSGWINTPKRSLTRTLCERFMLHEW